MNIGLFGIGTIGSGVFEQINAEASDFSKSTKIPAKITKILDKDTSKQAEGAIITQNPADILEDDSIEIIVSLMGGKDFEYEQIKKALESKKHVVTANKAVLAEHLKELTDLARENGVMLRYEASVGGGIPIIKTLEDQLRNNKINKISGILNGTTNFVLSKLQEGSEDIDFERALEIAMEDGFAEANYAADVEGDDIVNKLCILASLATGKETKPEDVEKVSLTDYDLSNLSDLNQEGQILRYAARADFTGDENLLQVKPVLFPEDNLFSNINNEYNIVRIETDKLGRLDLIGKGAGKDATANAVVGDVLDIIESLSENRSIELPTFE